LYNTPISPFAFLFNNNIAKVISGCDEMFIYKACISPNKVSNKLINAVKGAMAENKHHLHNHQLFLPPHFSIIKSHHTTMQQKLLLLFCFNLFVSFLSGQALPSELNGYKFTAVKTLTASPVQNQNKSGTCWVYSTNSFLESELKRMGKPAVDLSEMCRLSGTRGKLYSPTGCCGFRARC
jgi:C1A family cysteine protease